MEYDDYIDFLKKHRRKPILTMGIPGFDPQKTYIFDVSMAEDNTFNIRFEYSTIGRDAIPTEPLEPELVDYVFKFGLQRAEYSNQVDGSLKMMFTNLSAFENFLKSTLPYATNKL